MRYLLDTNICIYLIKTHPPEMLEKFKKHRPQDVAISIITLFELEYGVEKSQQQHRAQKALEQFLLPLNILDLDRAAASEAAIIRAQLERNGTTIGPYDTLIAGQARSQALTLVTNNTREFERINGLTLENWSL